MTIDVVMFDLGGVLIELKGLPIDPDHTEADGEAIMKAWARSPAVRRFESGQSDPHTFAAEMIEEFSVNTSVEQFVEHFANWPNGLIQGAEELLARLAKAHHLACLSNTNALHWDRFEREETFLEHFHTHLPSHHTGYMKPDTIAFQHAADHLQVTPANILFLDDNQYNVDAARAIGMQAELTRGVDEATRHIQQYGLI